LGEELIQIGLWAVSSIPQDLVALNDMMEAMSDIALSSRIQNQFVGHGQDSVERLAVRRGRSAITHCLFALCGQGWVAAIIYILLYRGEEVQLDCK